MDWEPVHQVPDEVEDTVTRSDLLESRGWLTDEQVTNVTNGHGQIRLPAGSGAHARRSRYIC